jgi:hypothetical protein
MRFPIAPLLAACSMMVPTTAIAADDNNPAADHLAPLRACTGETDPRLRLVCYDAAAAEVIAAADKGQLKIVDQAEIRRTRRGLFGFSLPDLGLFGGGDDAPDMDMLETTITGVRYTGDDAFVFKTKEGATWQVLNAPSRLREVHSGDAVVFKKAAMGSYFIRIDGQIGVKGKRVE